MHARVRSPDPAYASAGIIPYSSQGFWLARMSKGWSDFGGKKEPGDGNDPWATARRECKEESGLDAPNFECAVTEPAGTRRHFVYCSRVEAAPSPPSRERRQIAAVRLITWGEYMRAGLPADLHPRLKFDHGGRVRAALRHVATALRTGPLDRLYL